MTYHYGMETLKDLATFCPGMQYLRGRMRAIVAGQPVESIRVFDGDEWSVYPPTREGIRDAAQNVVEIDDLVRIQFQYKDKKSSSLYALYDGPYDADTRDEIINDYGVSLSPFLDH
jgi:hypothetical protein